VTDQRDRVTTDPGIGPVLDNSAHAGAIAATEVVEPDGASLYYEPKPLIAPSDHKTLEIATVKLSDTIDPRKLPTQLSLQRSPPPPPFDSGWPQAALAVASSQPPPAPRPRGRTPLVVLALLSALLVLALGRVAARHVAGASDGPRAAAVQPPAVPPAVLVPRAEVRTPSSESLAAAQRSAQASPSASVAPLVPSAPSAVPSPAAAVGAAAEHTANQQPGSALFATSPASSARGGVTSAPSAAKPKRAIY